MIWVLLGVGVIAFLWWRGKQTTDGHRAIGEAGPMAWDRWQSALEEAAARQDNARLVALAAAQRSRAVEETAASLTRMAESLRFLDDVDDLAHHTQELEEPLKLAGLDETIDRCLKVLHLSRAALADRDNLNLGDYENPDRAVDIKACFDTLTDLFEKNHGRFRSVFVNIALAALEARKALLEFGEMPSSFARTQRAYVKVVEYERASFLLGVGLSVLENHPHQG